ncbi:MAG: response regulator [Candidatus Margulisbacteria bacterium]|nr:response regulator [Candidatus Margulisiibacteriota bacterium]
MANQPLILIIEDEADIRTALTMRLEAKGFAVASASDGVAGLKLAREITPSLIILDIMLPKMDGYTISRMFKYDERFSAIPIIMLTAKVQPKDIERGKEAGADAYMTKPYEAEELIAKINELLGR